MAKTNVEKEREALASQDRDVIKQAQRDYAERTYGVPAAEASNDVGNEPVLDSVDDLPTKAEAAKTTKAVKAEEETD